MQLTYRLSKPVHGCNLWGDEETKRVKKTERKTRKETNSGKLGIRTLQNYFCHLVPVGFKVSDALFLRVPFLHYQAK